MSVGFVRTGRGEEGAEGLGAIKEASGITIAQSEDNCVVAGMPGAAIVKGYANRIVPLDAICQHLVVNFGGGPSSERQRQEKFDRPEKHDRDDKSDKHDKNDKNERIPASSNKS